MSWSKIIEAESGGRLCVSRGEKSDIPEWVKYEGQYQTARDRYPRGFGIKNLYYEVWNNTVTGNKGYLNMYLIQCRDDHEKRWVVMYPNGEYWGRSATTLQKAIDRAIRDAWQHMIHKVGAE